VTGPHTAMPDLSTYVALIERFVGEDIDAKEFDLAYLQTFLGDARMLGEPWYPILNDLFAACEDYVDEPALRTDSDDLDDAQLIDAARTARARLAALGV